MVIQAEFASIKGAYDIQRTLSRAQATPIVGVAVSVVKSAVSLVEIIVGVAGTIFFSAMSFLTLDKEMASYAFKSMLHTGLGLSSFIYSGINMATLGFAGFALKKLQVASNFN